MGIKLGNVLCSLCLICLLFVLFTIGHDERNVQLTIPRRNANTERSGVPLDYVDCRCLPCMLGDDCSESVANIDPKFSNRFTFVEVNSDHHKHGTPLTYNYTTYPGTVQCPCPVIEYTITDVEDVMEADNPNRFRLFQIDSQTGIIQLSKDRKSDISSADMYRLTVGVRNTATNATDHTLLTVAREKLDETGLYTFGLDNGYGNGYADVHHIQKRSVVPDNLTFTLTQTNSATEIRVGTRVIFQLDIVFPATPVDLLVELFTPDNETTVMILCGVEVISTGSNLQGPLLAGNLTYDAKSGYDSNIQADRAIIDFATISNNLADTSQISASTLSIKYEAVMIENSLTENATYWVSAGAQYLSEDNIWVGQSSFEAIVDGNMTVDSDPVFNVTMPTNIAIGSSHIVEVDMYIPYPTRSYISKVFTPSNTVGVMSICGIWFGDFGNNFGCGNDLSQITSTIEKDPQSGGNAIGVLDLGILLNKGSRDVIPVVVDNRVTVRFIAHIYPDVSLVNQVLSLGISLQVDTDVIWIGSSNFTVDDAITTGLTNPVYVDVTSSLSSSMDDATLGQPFSLTYEISVPTPNTADVASHYVLEILAPFDVTPIFSVCVFRVISVGRDMPCLITDDLVTEFGSRDTSGTVIEPDSATIDLGYVTNLGIFTQPGDDTITIEAVLKPLTSHSSATVASIHTVSFGATVGTTPITIVDLSIAIANEAVITPVTNSTAPTFSMAFYDSTDVVPVTGSTKVVIDMTTSRNIIYYDEIDLQFLMPTTSIYSLFHLCRVDIISNGKNMPCMTPEWYGNAMQYLSAFDSYEIDRAKLTIGSMCNHEFEDNVAEDVTSFALYIQIPDRTDLPDGASNWISTALQYSSTSLLVGQLKLDVSRGQFVSPSQSTYGILGRNTTTSPTPNGLTVSYSLLLKLARGDSAHIQVNASSQDESAHICTVRVYSAGSNFPCVTDEVATRTHVQWPSGSGRKETFLDLGFVTNYGLISGNMTANDYFDSDSIIIETIVRANPGSAAGTYPIDITVYFDTAKSSFSSFTRTDFITTEDVSSVPTTTTNPVTTSMSVGDITGGDNTTEIAIGEAKRVMFTAVVPEESLYELEFTFTHPDSDIGKIEICDAAIVSVGDNLPCINPLTEAEISQFGSFSYTATFNLGFVCSCVLRPGDEKANTVVFEAYVRVLPNNMAAIGDTVTVFGTLRTFTDTVTVDTIEFTVTDPTLFVDRASSLTGVTNETLISLDQSSTTTMKSGEVLMFTAGISVPQTSVSRFLFDVDVPIIDTACITVNDIRILGSVGRNVLCVPPSTNNKGVVYTLEFNDSLSNGQHNYVYIDLGIVTNTGLTYRRNTYVTGDDDILIEFDIQMADCTSNENGTIHKLSIGNKIANYIFIYDHDIQVFRDGYEKPDILFTAHIGTASTSTIIYIEGTVYHNTSSSAEGRNTSIFVNLPVYQTAPTALLTSSNQSCNVIPDSDNPTLLEIFCPNFFFTDIYTFTAVVAVNSLVILPPGYTATNSIAVCYVGTDFLIRYPTYSLEDWYPYMISGEHDLDYSVDAGTDSSCMGTLGIANNLVVLDCQITSSTGNSPAGPAHNIRMNSGGAWTPLVRNGKFAEKRYSIVYFGNTHTFTKIDVQQNNGHTHYITEISVQYTNDGLSWFGAETVSLGTSPAVLETRALSGQNARGVMISIVSDQSNGNRPDVGVQFELYGCKLENVITQADACAAIADIGSLETVPTDFGYRSFVAGLTNEVFVCDRDVNSEFYKGICKTSADSGASWKKMDHRLASVIGYESGQGRVYGYSQNKQTIMMRDGGPWTTVTDTILAEDKLKLGWKSAKVVIEDANALLDKIYPHYTYTIDNWGATYDGICYDSAPKLYWES